MSKLETPMIMEYWDEVGGTLITEFQAVPRMKGVGRRLIDAVILPDMPKRQAHWREQAIDGLDVIAIQAKAHRLGMYVMGQAIFSVRLLQTRFKPKSVMGVILCSADDTRRWARVRRLLQDIREWGERRNVRVRMLSRRRVRKVFAERNAQTKEEIAAAIAAQFPELALQLPPHRKCYMSEDARMSIFDAAALAVTVFANRRRVEREVGEEELSAHGDAVYLSSRS